MIRAPVKPCIASGTRVTHTDGRKGTATTFYPGRYTTSDRYMVELDERGPDGFWCAIWHADDLRVEAVEEVR